MIFSSSTVVCKSSIVMCVLYNSMNNNNSIKIKSNQIKIKTGCGLNWIAM